MTIEKKLLKILSNSVRTVIVIVTAIAIGRIIARERIIVWVSTVLKVAIVQAPEKARIRGEVRGRLVWHVWKIWLALNHGCVTMVGQNFKP